MALAQVSLDDRYALERGRVLMTGIQALVRLPMLQRQRDLAAGLNTAGFISGYRGSPLGGLDQALWRARKFLESSEHRLPARHQRGPRPPPRSGARSRSACSRAPSTTACSRSGTARAPASTARSTCSSTATTPAPRKHGGVLVVAGDDHARQVLDPAAPVRPRLRRRRDPGAQPVGRAGLSRPRHPWLGDVALLRLLGRVQGGDRHGREHGRGRRRPAPRRGRCCRPTSSCRRAACRSAGPIRRWPRKRGCRSTRPMPRWPIAAPTS